MRTLAAGSRGFTLLELLVVVAIMALATAGVGFALRDSADSQLEREAQRLIALLESARAQSRMTANPIHWRAIESGFVFDGAAAAPPTPWLGSDVLATVTSPVVLGPEPIIGPQRIVLSSRTQPGRSLTIATDGLRPFAVVTDGDPSAGTP